MQYLATVFHYSLQKAIEAQLDYEEVQEHIHMIGQELVALVL